MVEAAYLEVCCSVASTHAHPWSLADQVGAAEPPSTSRSKRRSHGRPCMHVNAVIRWASIGVYRLYPAVQVCYLTADSLVRNL